MHNPLQTGKCISHNWLTIWILSSKYIFKYWTLFFLMPQILQRLCIRKHCWKPLLSLWTNKCMSNVRCTIQGALHWVTFFHLNQFVHQQMVYNLKPWNIRSTFPGLDLPSHSLTVWLEIFCVHYSCSIVKDFSCPFLPIQR